MTPLGVTGPAVRRTLAIALGASVLGLPALALVPADGAPGAAPPSTPSYAATAGAGNRIDTSDKQAVLKAWRTRYKANLGTESGWIGSVQGCLAGTITAEAQAATKESINFARGMAGLDPIAFDDTLSGQAQQAALLMDANDALSHDPPATWNCWTPVAAAAAGKSNLALTTGTMTAGGAIDLYLSDPGPSNTVAGHRRWVLFPPAKTFGHGMTDTADALYVIGPTDPERRNPAWVPWPTRGWFPYALRAAGRWSLSSGRSDADFSQATVVVTHGGHRMDVTRYKPINGYGMPTLVFRVADLSTGSYRVVVRHVRKAASTSYAYTVRLFKP